MPRFTMTTAMAVSLTALGLGGTAHAACVETGTATSPELTCTGAGLAQIDDGRDTLSVVFDATAALVRGVAEGRPVTLSGADQSLDIASGGLIESQDPDEDAIQGEGANLTLTNAGTIKGGDRGVRLQDDADNVTITNSGEISARRQAVRFDNGDELANATITNSGLIESSEGRAIQSRGPGTTIINSGILRGNEEVVEAREGFSMVNTGTIALEGLSWDAVTETWTNDGATTDEDGVQFAGGTLTNEGVILGTDDGVDLDQGTLVNSGAIVSTGADGDPSNGGSGIDIDETFEPTVGQDAPAGPLTIQNSGYIEGVRAIGADSDSTSELTIANSGTLVGRSGTAIEMAPGQGNSSLTLDGDSAIFGDVLFGGGNDLLTVGTVSSGPLINSVFDGGAGDNTVSFAALALGDVTTARFGSDLTALTLDTPNGAISGEFRNFGLWQFGTAPALTTAEFRSALPQSVVVPVPAALPLLLSALGGLAWMRRRPRG